LTWPPALAPFTAHVCALGEEGLAAANEICAIIEGSGIDVLLDDRGERAGVQFADAELIGCPLQVTISKRSLASGGIEVKQRKRANDAAEKAGTEVISGRDVVDWVRACLDPG
jgi:prolyl-tRNA synthetase